MGLLSIITRALGLEREPTPERGPVSFTDAAKKHLRSLPRGGVRVLTIPTDGGWMVQVEEVNDASAHPQLDGLPVVADEAVLARMHGLQLDHDGREWRVLARVTVRARETPNPNGRLYLTDRPLSEGYLTWTTSTGAPKLARNLLARPDITKVFVRGDTLTIERTPESPWDGIDSAVAAAIREHVLLCGELLRPAERRLGDPLEQAVHQLLDARVRPGLQADGGDIELVRIVDGVVYVRLVGACESCPASTLTLQGGVEKAVLEAFPDEIHQVVAV